MISQRVVSPELLRRGKNNLVPYKHKYSTKNLAEVPGWRVGHSESPDLMKIEPSKLFKVKSKQEFYLPRITAMEKSSPVILETKKVKPAKRNPISKKPLIKKSEIRENDIPKLLKSTSPRLKQSKILIEDVKVFNKIYNLDDIKNTNSVANLNNSKQTKKLTGNSNLNTFYDSPEGYKSDQSTVAGHFNNSDKFERGVVTPTLKATEFSITKKTVANRRNSETLTAPNSKPHLLMPQRRTMNFQEELKSIQGENNFSDSESVSNDDENDEDNPIEEIKNLRNELKINPNKNSRRSSRLLFVDMEQSEGSSRYRNSENYSSLSNSYNERKSSARHKTDTVSKDVYTAPRKSVTKQLSKKDFKEAQNMKRSSTTANQLLNIGFGKLNTLSSISNLTPTDLKNSAFNSFTPTPHALKNPIQQFTQKNSLKPRPSYSLSSKPKQVSNSAEKQAFNQANHKYSLAHTTEKTFPNQIKPKLSLTQNSEKRPSIKVNPETEEVNFVSKKSLKMPPKKTKTFNNDFTEHSETRQKKKKQLTVEASKKPRSKNKRITAQDSSSDPEMKVLIKITEAPDSKQESFYRDSNYLVSGPNFGDSPSDRQDPSFSNRSNQNLLAMPKGPYSDIPGRSRANSHEWSKPENHDVEFARKRMSSNKLSKKLEVPFTDFKKKMSSSPRPKKNPSDLNIDEINSEYSYDSNTSNYSKKSVSKKTTLDQRYLKKNSVSSPRKNNSLRNPNSIRFLKPFISSEINKKLTGLNPVTNFLYNFSFSILKCISSLVKVNNFRRGSKLLNKQRSKRLLPSEIFEKDALANGKLKINKNKPRESKIFTPISLQVPVKRMKTIRNTEIPQVYYPREITLKAMHSLKVKKEKFQQSRISQQEIRVTSESPEEGYFDSSESRSSDYEDESENKVVPSSYSKKTLLYELAHQDLTLQIAKQILESNCMDRESRVSDSEEEEIVIDELDESDSHDLQDEIFEISSKLNYFNGKYAFGHEVDIKALQKHQMVFSFKEVEQGFYEIDMDNLIRESEKNTFLQKRNLNNNDKKNSETDDGVVLISDWNMTEEQMYRARMQKLKMIRKKIAKRKERMNALMDEKKGFNMDSKIENLMLLSELPVLGDTFEERVYCRLKGSVSPVFIKNKL